METRTVLLTLHIAAVAAWLGADIVVHAIAHRVTRDSPAAATAWARVEVFLHDKYYAIVAVVVLATGILLVLDGDWSWSSEFIWFGVVAIIGGATLGGGVLKSMAVKKLAALEAGDSSGAEELEKRMFPITLVLTALPVIALYAMVDKIGI